MGLRKIFIGILSFFITSCSGNIEKDSEENAKYDMKTVYSCLAKDDCTPFLSGRAFSFDPQKSINENISLIQTTLRHKYLSYPEIDIQSPKNTKSVFSEANKIIKDMGLEVIEKNPSKGWIYSQTKTHKKEFIGYKWENIYILMVHITRNVDNENINIYISCYPMEKKPLSSLFYDQRKDEESKRLEIELLNKLESFIKDK